MLSEKLDKPPAKAALKKLVKRASLQSQGWIRATHFDQKLPNPSDYRWTKDIHVGRLCGRHSQNLRNNAMNQFIVVAQKPVLDVVNV